MSKKFVPVIVGVVLAALLVGGLTSCMSVSGDSSNSSSVADYEEVDAQFVVDNGNKIPLVDVRTASEYSAGHIPGAVNIEYSSTVENDSSLISTMVDEYVNDGINSGDSVILYCRTGKRAASAAEILAKAGYSHIYVYTGSWTDWTSDSSREIAV